MSISDAFDGKHAALTDRIVKVFYAVNNELGDGFMEKVYRKSMLLALRQAGLKAEEEVAITVYFRGEDVGTYYADIMVADLIILELKAVDTITARHKAQLTHYLRSTPLEVGYVFAFGDCASFERVILTNDRKRNLPRP